MQNIVQPWQPTTIHAAFRVPGCRAAHERVQLLDNLRLHGRVERRGGPERGLVLHLQHVRPEHV